MSSLFEKYDVPAPRYTSYPTVPYWEDAPTEAQWFADLKKTAEQPESTWSLYLHLPFCESHCTFCGCNTVTTHNHTLEKPYAAALEAELSIYLRSVPGLRNKPLRQMHLGGGTPTFFSAESLERLLGSLLEGVHVDEEHFDGSVEVNPNYTNDAQLDVLRAFGFRRISIGVQDFDEKVQKVVNRLQSRESTERVAERARALGFTSVNFDLIFGLPNQTLETMRETANITIAMRPDRIALYSLALVPWLKPGHKRLAETAPKGPEKRALYELCREAFLDAGYVEIGMDHFALPSDSLAKAVELKTLHRNFMGYTHLRTDILLALGVSSISQSPGCFHQNEKGVDVYKEAVTSGRLATHRGHVLTDEDRRRQQQILDLMTRFEVRFEDESQEARIRSMLSPLVHDRLIEISGGKLRLTPAGRPFLRNACMAFDERLQVKTPETKVFSQSV